ncbi:MAG: recombinase family protein [Bryobacterales bacterium]|nr:recombinase family protein [Bryobacterales bacterium]
MIAQALNGWTLIEERFDDDGVSGATLNRPALQRLLIEVRAHRVEQVIVYRLDRLARSVVGSVRLLEEFRKHKTKLVIVTAPELGCGAQDNLVLNILASFAEFEREMIASRIAEARVALKARGRRIAGAVPYGYDADPGTKQLVPNESESAVVKWMFEEAAAGKLPAEIAQAANERGWRTKITAGRRNGKLHGGGLWTARQILATLRNPVYIGSFREKNGVRGGHHEPIVSGEIFASVADQLQSRRTRAPGKRYNIDWPFKGRIQCAMCERPMTPHLIRYKNWLYRYYRCRSTEGGRKPCSRQVCAQDIETAVQQQFWINWRVKLESNQLRDHVESIIYDWRDDSIRAFLIRPEPAPEAAKIEPPPQVTARRRRR